MSSSNSVCVHCGEAYGQHDPAPRLSSSQVQFIPTTSIPIDPVLTARSTRAAMPHVPPPLHVPPPPSLHLSLPAHPSRAIPQPVPPPLPPRHSQLHTSSQSAVGTAVPFYPPGPSTMNRPFGVASTTGAATALPYSMYTAPQLFTAAGTQALGKRKRGRGKASQLLESACPRRYELTVVIDCQAVSAQLLVTCTSNNITIA